METPQSRTPEQVRFPDNLRGQELARKETTGEITPEEKAELMALTRSTRERIENL